MEKHDLYAVLTKYDDPDAIDSKALGEGANVNHQTVAAKKGQQKCSAEIYQKLLDDGWSDAQIPWLGGSTPPGDPSRGTQNPE